MLSCSRKEGSVCVVAVLNKSGLNLKFSLSIPLLNINSVELSKQREAAIIHKHAGLMHLHNLFK